MSNKDTKKETYFVSGGGTGGHIYPALAIIEELKNKDADEVYYLGNPNNPEYKLATAKNINFLPVNISAMPRKISFGSILWIFKLFFAIIKSVFYVKKYNPKLICGTGGYVSAPILFAAKILKIPYALHDADAQPGIVSRCFSSGAKILTTPFEVVKEILPATNVVVTGNPIRQDFSNISKEEAYQELGITPKLTLLVMGGSQGARSINNALIPILKRLIEEFDVCILHQSGNKRYEEVKELLNEYFPEYESCSNYRLMPYIDDMPTIMKASDIAICRSGSLSLSEIMASGLASILIPYPFSAGNHQKRNAQVMVDLGCSIMVEDKDLTSEKLYSEISNIIKSQDMLNQMKKNSLKHAKINATCEIVERLINL